MALNYLQRVAGAAVRTAIPAKPVATGPPRMPVMTDARVQPIVSGDYFDSETDSEVNSSSDTTVAPAGLQPLSGAAETVLPTAPEVGVAPSRVPPPPPERRAEALKPTLFESLLRPPSEVILAPPGLRTIARRNLDRSARSVISSPVPVAPAANLVAESERLAETAELNIRSATPLPVVEAASTPRQPTTLATANIQPQPAAPTAVSMPGSHAEKPESRIHIGRVEVQVNNRPPAGTPPKVINAATPAADPLSPRFLERFLFRF